MGVAYQASSPFELVAFTHWLPRRPRCARRTGQNYYEVILLRHKSITQILQKDKTFFEAIQIHFLSAHKIRLDFWALWELLNSFCAPNMLSHRHYDSNRRTVEVCSSQRGARRAPTPYLHKQGITCTATILFFYKFGQGTTACIVRRGTGFKSFWSLLHCHLHSLQSTVPYGVPSCA